MVTIKIGGSELTFNNICLVDENWIIQQINGLRHDDKAICIRVMLHTDAVNIILTGGECIGNSGGVARTLTQEEADVFDLCEKLGLNRRQVEGGKVVAFFKQVGRIAD